MEILTATRFRRRTALWLLLVFALLVGLPGVSFAFPQVASVTASQETAATTTHTINLPSANVGDLLITFFSADGTAWTIFAWDTGAGRWPALGCTSPGAALAFCARYRIVDGTELSTYTIEITEAEKSATQVYRITNWHGATAPERAFASSSGSATADPPNLALLGWGATEETLWLIAAVSDADTTFSADPANYTNPNENNSAGATTGVKLRTLRRNLKAASDNPDAFANTNRPWITLTVAIRPNPGSFGRRAFRGGP